MVHTYVTTHAEHLAHPDVFLATGIYVQCREIQTAGSETVVPLHSFAEFSFGKFFVYTALRPS